MSYRRASRLQLLVGNLELGGIGRGFWHCYHCANAIGTSTDQETMIATGNQKELSPVTEGE